MTTKISRQDESIVEEQGHTGKRTREFQREGKLVDQLGSFTSPKGLDTTYYTHGLHPYPAKYIPQLPNLIIREHTNERNTVFDPFCGSGTTLLEAALLGRKSVGCDSNPVATLIARAKTKALTEDELDTIRKFSRRLSELRVTSAWPKEFAKRAGEVDLEHWFAHQSIDELLALRKAIQAQRSPAVRDFLFCVLSSIVVTVSFQESDTRYAAKRRIVQPGETLKRFEQKLKRDIVSIETLSSLKRVARNTPLVITTDVRSVLDHGVRENSVDLIVTSPPYPNSFDYYLYHKWRMFWLGYDFTDVKKKEIGSRHEHSSQKQPIESYITKMHGAMSSVARALKPSKLAYFFVGDAVVQGEFVEIDLAFKKVIEGLDLRMVESTNYSLEAITRSFRERRSAAESVGQVLPSKKQHVLVFERVNKGKVIFGTDRSQATATPERDYRDLSGSVESGSTIAIRSADSSRHIHSLGRYPSKFIPEVPKWAIEEFSTERDIVLDPFVGSGTTLVEANLLGRSSVGCDISPYSCLLSEGKTSRFEQKELVDWTDDLIKQARGGFSGMKSTIPVFPLSEFWFPEGYVKQIGKARSYIQEAVPKHMRSYFLAVLSTVIRPCSYQDEGQIKVKRDARKVLQGTPMPLKLLVTALEKNRQRKSEYLELAHPRVSTSLFNESAENVGRHLDKRVGLVVTSPPYINAMNYPMTHRYENLLLGLIPPSHLREHEREYYGTERFRVADYRELKSLPNDFERAKELNAQLAQVFKLEPKRSQIAANYFVRMQEAIASSCELLRKNGHYVMVAGRNRIKGVPIDTFGILCSMLEANGMKEVTVFDYEIVKNAFKLTRHRTADIIKTDGVGVFVKTA